VQTHGYSPYKCYQQYDPSQIPNLAALATSFAVSDRTFEFRTSPSWAGHMVLASATLDGFEGDNPKMVIPGFTVGPGWGCDSNKEEQWSDGTTSTLVPTCIPDANGNGPVVASPVAYVPTIFDSMDAASEAWKLYAGAGSDGYRWNICPTFYECLGGTQRQNWVPAANVLTDATAGNLPALSIVTPRKSTSQHNGFSMAIGDNWIGSVVSAIENGPDWMTTAIFITYDDCGCFYDHVNPVQFNTDWGIRVPMVIVTGGKQPGDRVTQGFAGYDYLKAQGVPEDDIKVEVEGRNSYEELSAAAVIVRQAKAGPDVLLISDPYHSLRISQIAEEVGLRPHVSPADSPSPLRSLMRETVAVSIGRIIGYRRLASFA